MSITTGRGDGGETDLLFGKRIAKTAARMVAVGSVDELNTALGVARAAAGDDALDTILDALQERLVGLMGELAVLPEDVDCYREAGYPSLGPEDVALLEGEAGKIEQSGIRFDGWARPGAAGKLVAAHLDLARAICRRAERHVLAIEPPVENREILRFLNRASDLLWLLARRVEQD